MARASIAAGERAYTVNFDEPRRRGDLHQSIAIALLVDELTGEAMSLPVRVTTDAPRARPKTAPNGIAGVAGVPSRIFPELDGQPYTFTCRFDVDGFAAWQQAVTVPQQPSFPDDFVDVDLGALALRRRPVSLIARALELDPQHRPVAVSGATIEISTMWRRTRDLTGAATPANLVALRPAMSAPRPQPGTTLEAVNIAPVVEVPRTLERDTAPGEVTAEVSRTGAVAPGSLVAFDRADADRSELIEIQDVRGPSDPDSPATFVLAFPVQHRHAHGTTAEAVTATPAGLPTAQLSDAAMPSDATVFVTLLAPFAAAPIVRISGGAAPDEYAVASRYRMVTDADGYARFPPLTRVAAVEVIANAPGPLAAGPAPWTPRYSDAENQLHLMLE